MMTKYEQQQLSALVVSVGRYQDVTRRLCEALVRAGADDWDDDANKVLLADAFKLLSPPTEPPTSEVEQKFVNRAPAWRIVKT